MFLWQSGKRGMEMNRIISPNSVSTLRGSRGNGKGRCLIRARSCEMLKCISTAQARTKCVSAFWARSRHFFYKVALVTCWRSFWLRRLVQSVRRGFGARHFSCKFLYRVPLVKCWSAFRLRRLAQRVGPALRIGLPPQPRPPQHHHLPPPQHQHHHLSLPWHRHPRHHHPPPHLPQHHDPSPHLPQHCHPGHHPPKHYPPQPHHLPPSLHHHPPPFHPPLHLPHCPPPHHHHHHHHHHRHHLLQHYPTLSLHSPTLFGVSCRDDFVLFKIRWVCQNIQPHYKKVHVRTNKPQSDLKPKSL